MKISNYFPVVQVNPNKKQEDTQRPSLGKEREGEKPEGEEGGGGGEGRTTS